MSCYCVPVVCRCHRYDSSSLGGGKRPLPLHAHLILAFHRMKREYHLLDFLLCWWVVGQLAQDMSHLAHSLGKTTESGTIAVLLGWVLRWIWSPGILEVYLHLCCIGLLPCKHYPRMSGSKPKMVILRGTSESVSPRKMSS